jgi:hypothetical protein
MEAEIAGVGVCLTNVKEELERSKPCVRPGAAH